MNNVDRNLRARTIEAQNELQKSIPTYIRARMVQLRVNATKLARKAIEEKRSTAAVVAASVAAE